MKKLIFIFIFFIAIHCYAQNTDLKHYYDISQGFDGWAMAIYLENIAKSDLAGHEKEFMDFVNDELSKKFTPATKLTKNNNWLFHKALNEWDYEKDEVYAVVCADSKYAKDGIFIFTVIMGENDFLWCAYSVKEEDLNNIDDLFK